jgi:hypothetical protein
MLQHRKAQFVTDLPVQRQFEQVQVFFGSPKPFPEILFDLNAPFLQQRDHFPDTDWREISVMVWVGKFSSNFGT